MSGYVCPKCAKRFRYFQKNIYVDHLKRHAIKNIQKIKIEKYLIETENKINEFKEIKSLSSFIKCVIDNYSIFQQYIFKHNINLDDEIIRRTKKDLSCYIDLFEKPEKLNKDDMVITYYPTLNVLWEGNASYLDLLYEDCKIESYNPGVAIHKKNNNLKKLPSTYFRSGKRYIDFGNFKIHIANLPDSSLYIVILFEPNDHKSIATAKLISD